jgi:hypothetical protein
MLTMYGWRFDVEVVDAVNPSAISVVTNDYSGVVPEFGPIPGTMLGTRCMQWFRGAKPMAGSSANLNGKVGLAANIITNFPRLQPWQTNPIFM